jgi:hypothetical protein
MIVINNKSYSGQNISVSRNRIYIDGIEITDSSISDAKEINISVNGDINELSVDACNSIEITGNVNKATSGSGDINCASILNGARTGSGDIESDLISGDVSTGSGDVKCTTITGSVRTGSGDIKYKK